MSKTFRVKFFFNSYLKGYITEMVQNIIYSILFKARKERKFVIFTGGRTGSTLLLSLLNSHPEINCDGEILKGRVFSPFRFVQKKMAMDKAPIYGFKLLSYQLRDIQSGIADKREFLEKLQDDGFRIIYLERKSRAYQSLSVMYAMQQDSWHSNGKQSPRPKVTFEIPAFEQVFNNMESLTRFEKNILEGLDFLHLTYEDNLMGEASNRRTIREVCKFLDIGYSGIKKPTLRKILPADLSKFLSNPREVSVFLKKREAQISKQ